MLRRLRYVQIFLKNNLLESVHPTDYVVYRTCLLVVSSPFGQPQSYILDRFCRHIWMNRFYLDVKTGIVFVLISLTVDGH